MDWKSWASEMCIRDRINYEGKSVALLVKENDGYGQTFIDWFAFQVRLLCTASAFMRLLLLLAPQSERGPACRKPVSYTHLDVYKRQLMVSSIKATFKFN